MGKKDNEIACKISGYTYLAVLLLVAVVGLALAATATVWSTVQRRDQEQELLFLGGQMRHAIARYAAEGGSYPRHLGDLLKDPRFPGIRRYLRVIPRDPVSGGDTWGLVRGPGEVIVGVYSLAPGRPIKQRGFSADFRSFEGRTRYADWVFTAQGAKPPGAPGAARPGTDLAAAGGLKAGAAQKNQAPITAGEPR